MQNPSPFPLNLTPEDAGFEVGQYVEWCGIAGKVLSIKKGKMKVGFTNRHICEFFIDGRYMSWHEKSSLTLLKDDANG